MSGDRVPLDRRQALQRLVAHPALPEVLSSLAPRTLTRLYQAVGLHDAGALMAATPPELLARALDEAVWQDDTLGTRFDADVFVDWLEVWLDAGEPIAAERLWALDDEVRALALAELIAVEDSLVAGFGHEEEDAPELPADEDASMVLDRFLIRARQPDEWDIARSALLALWEDDPDRLVTQLDRLSVIAGAGRRRLQQDAAADREGRREHAGFVSVAAARSFLGSAHLLTPEALADMREYDPESARHLTRLERRSPDQPQHTPGGEVPSAAGAAEAAVEAAEAAVEAAEAAVAAAEAARAEVDALLREADLTEPLTTTARLSGPAAARATRLEQRLLALAQEDPAALDGSAAELAYLANVLQATPAAATRGTEARLLAMAVANLGMELLEARGRTIVPGREPGLIQPFLLGWRALVELPGQLLRALEEGLAAPAVEERLAARPWLQADIEQSVDDLRRAVRSEDHAAGREALALLSLVFDPAACRAAGHLLAVPPAFPVALAGGPGEAARPLRTRDELHAVYRLLQTIARGGYGTSLNTSLE